MFELASPGCFIATLNSDAVASRAIDLLYEEKARKLDSTDFRFPLT
jgi:hypothetical protein